MRIRLACLLIALAASSTTGIADPGKQKLQLPEAEKIPVLRVAPGYDYMAGDPAALAVNTKMGSFVWLAYFNGEPAKYVGEPGAPAAGRREIWIESSLTPGFETVLATAPGLPDQKGHIKMAIAPKPLGFTTALGGSRTYYVRAHNSAGFSNPVAVNISGLVVKKN